ncbi:MULTISPECIES: N-acetylglucosamine-6-phosphate deacetylase [Arthrobacter]|uniref:N-acetylglucosamine-6-phosphate deacetylase n=1 Tax=Arthrobacter terricola TaxID=2547396 RepID=A0A4R5KMW6_9MICC|nr:MULTISPECIES: N-acetylglucosamine-6-phosphate deacetylase [Arthrobacter]MBT8161122.1 N-acetylglucosamine-6-phosphate deacetylase [Arthrobacter sp. GN70]TDF96973.1 N-acetylglucosamine-6-phosphate deacetylase [Arthrobacter terricola]
MTATDQPTFSSAPVRHLITGTIVTDATVIEDGLVAVEDGRIVFSGVAAEFDEGSFEGFEETLRTDLPSERYLVPGFVDVHCHGGNGGDFPGAEEASARKAIDFLHRSGTTTFLASMVTAPREDLLRGIELFVRLADEGLVAGIHLEGPFLSHARCGAQNPAYLLEPDLGLLNELVEAAAGKLATMTYAPELPGAAELVDLMTFHGVTPSLGHTDCDDATAAASLAAAREGLESAGFDGVSSLPTVTHLFNGMPPMHHRTPGPVSACLRTAQEGKAVLELIADGTHLDPSMVATVFQLVGASNIVLVTDSMAAAGLSDGNYMLGPSPVTVTNGVATLDSTGSIAGGTATMLDVVRHTVRAGVGLADAVSSATAVPAAVLGLSDELGGLRRGLRGDLVVVDKELQLAAVLRNGDWIA